MSTGPTGYLYHWSSKMLIHPKGGSHNPGNDTGLVVYASKNDPGRLQFRFVAVEGAGHYGYIEHVSSGKIVHPKGGSLNPDDNTHLVFHSGRHAGCLFGFDEANNLILHKSGKYWHPRGGSPSPGNDTPVVVHHGYHDGEKFYFGDIDGKAISPYPQPNLSGDWQLLQAFITPMADHTYNVKYKIGRSKTESQTTHQAWSVSAGAAYGFFSGSVEYSGYLEHTTSDTWNEEREESITINVKKGHSVYVWQYVFGAAQYGDELRFHSTIVGDTDSEDKKPVLK